MANTIYGCGRAIANSNTPHKKGTICCKLYHPSKNKHYLLTCNHVMHAGYSDNNNGWLDTPVSTIPHGNWAWGVRTEEVDIALIEIDGDIDFDYGDKIVNKHPRKLTDDDVLNTTIFMIGRDEADHPKIVSGKILNICSETPINVGYEDGEKQVNNLIVIAQVIPHADEVSYRTLSSAGDSGAVVCDDQGTLIGMAIAGNNQFTYVIPFDTILSATGTVLS